MPEDPLWFGCGTLLPGQGPGNYDDFDGGGTIDGGDGDDPDPPIPGGDFDQGGPPTDIDDGGGGGGEPGDPHPGNPRDPVEEVAVDQPVNVLLLATPLALHLFWGVFVLSK